jgi:hypothetical protein
VPFRAGQTFLFPISGEQTAHLWIIVTPPDKSSGVFLIVSLTSLKGNKDQTVVLRAGEHPFIKWDTCVAYGLSELTSEEKLQQLVDGREARLHQSDVSAKLLELILDGFLASDFTKRRITDFVKKFKGQAAKDAQAFSNS